MRHTTPYYDFNIINNVNVAVYKELMFMGRAMAIDTFLNIKNRNTCSCSAWRKVMI